MIILLCVQVRYKFSYVCTIHSGSHKKNTSNEPRFYWFVSIWIKNYLRTNIECYSPSDIKRCARLLFFLPKKKNCKIFESTKGWKKMLKKPPFFLSSLRSTRFYSNMYANVQFLHLFNIKMTHQGKLIFFPLPFSLFHLSYISPILAIYWVNFRFIFKTCCLN